MYSEEAISSLTGRIGWNAPLKPDFPIQIEESNLEGGSKRTFQSFHQLVTVENIYSMIADPNPSEEVFNKYLQDLRVQGVMDVLTSILDENELYNESVDYSEIILTRPRIFDNSIGYAIAVKALEMFISSGRKNADERNALMAYNALKIELEGIKNDAGHVVAKGIRYFLKSSIEKTGKIIFPIPLRINAPKLW